MAELNTQMGGGIQSSVTPTQPVVNTSASTVLNAVGTLAQGAFSAFQRAEVLAAKKAEQENELMGAKVVSSFRSEQLKIADAVDQGMPLSKARALMRINYDKFQANNPLLAKDITQAHKDIISTAGMGRVAAEGTEEQQLYASQREAAAKDGWLVDEGNEEEAVRNHLRFTRSRKELEEATAQVGLINARLTTPGKITSNESAAIALEEDKIRIQQEGLIGNMSDAYHYKFRDETSAIIEQFTSGQLPPNEALALLEGQWASVQGILSQSGRKTSREYLENVVSPMRNSFEAAKRVIAGTETVQSYESAIQRNLALQKLNITGNPQDARLIATTQLYRNVDYLITPYLNESVTRIVGSFVNPDSDTPNPYTKDNAKDFGTALKVVKSNLKAVANGLEKDGLTKDQVGISMNELLKGVSTYAAAVDNPTQARQIVEFFASPEVAAYIKSTGGLPPDSAQAAHDTLMQVYEQQVMPLIQEEYERAVTVTGVRPSGRMGVSNVMTPSTELVTPVFSGSGVMFKANGDKGKSKAEDLNRKVAPILNTLIRMGAHLEGSVDYKGVYQRNYESLFTVEKEGDNE